MTAAQAATREGDAWTTAADELELLDGAGGTLDPDDFATGKATPVFFGSAVSNFGVGLLLDALQTLAPSPQARDDVDQNAARDRRPVRGARLQGPGEHGPAPPRPRRVPAHRVGTLRARDEGRQRAQRQAVHARPRARGLRRRPRRPRRGLPRRRRRRHQRARPARRRHALPRRARRVPADPDARARALRDGAKPRRDPPQAVSPRPRAARRGGRRAPPPPRPRRRPRARPRRRRPAAVRGRRRAAAARVRRRGRPRPDELERSPDAPTRRAPRCSPEPPRRRPLSLDGTFMALFTSDFMLNRFEGLHPDVLLERMLTR